MQMFDSHIYKHFMFEHVSRCFLRDDRDPNLLNGAIPNAFVRGPVAGFIPGHEGEDQARYSFYRQRENEQEIIRAGETAERGKQVKPMPEVTRGIEAMGIAARGM